VADKDQFFSFEEALKELRLKEEELKRLVSEGEIRAFREGDQMKFRRTDVENLDVTGARSEEETGVIDLSKGKDESSETLTDDLIFDEGDELELDTDEAGMATAEITSQDTFVEEEPIGMSTEPLDFSAEEVEEEMGEVEEAPVRRMGGARPAARARYAQAEPTESILWPVVLGFAAVLLVLAGFVVVSLIQGHANSLSEGLGNFFGETFGPLPLK
jgi:excisionase family DNA binding protein